MSNLKKNSIIYRKFKLGNNIKSIVIKDEFRKPRTLWQCENKYSINSPKLASASSDKSIKFYELNSGKCVRTIPNSHPRSIRCLLYLPKTSELATGGDRLDNSIKIWSLSDSNFGKCTQKLNGHKSGINCLLLIPKTYKLASGSQDSTIKIWNLETGQILATLMGHTGWIQNLLYLPENHILISSDSYGIDYDQIIIWDLFNWQCIKTYINQGKTSDSCMVLLSNSAAIARGIGENVFIWNLNEEKILNVLEDHKWTVLVILVLANGDLITGSADKSIKLWRPAKTGKCLKTFKGHKSSVFSLISLQNQDELLSAAYDGSIKFWSLNRGYCLKTIISGHLSQTNSLISLTT